ncbi:1-deoxy-D-xylulose-5-phosphate reductoisomerase [Candidatus Formimonas warabiya]|uniref:1-deoxy-D-xylulose 5-phosphate reductoisomerase n=1 Tax=Formimonas warabiya TaxID=1761012 RepID=A0A3G1KR03_FORW1|nr:1-deoxy-D-xylulose-5-phosphate reductoisomerase [Candidatus Formimonas warabiya]ATW24535.1 1-deoxy-D-xylulose-5-phosphate reductoisomerase [Candidatus Formimonas warabiya]
MKRIALLGSTGSIGRQATEVVDWFPEEFSLVALAAHRHTDLLAEQVKKYQPEVVVIYDETCYGALKEKISFFSGEILVGMEGLIRAASWASADLVITAVSGVVGLLPTVKAIEAGKNIALANKETLVAAGPLVMNLAREKGIRIVPVDSEHSAIFQCFEGDGQAVEKILLTASGGPFRGLTGEQLKKVTPEMALKHPTWNMGHKITIDSATMMNKGLEVIEARWLFQVSYDDITVVVHPQSIIHSMVQYGDGSILGHLGKTDMRIPIQYALTYPDRWKNNLTRIDFAKLAHITFEEPDFASFPCLRIAYEAGREGGTYPAVMNGANEVLVDLFLSKKIGFMDIPAGIERILSRHQREENPSLEAILEADRWARKTVLEVV